ncbi:MULTISPECIES: amino acid ABC transporter permease [Desulfosporosinus]|uniref:Glutamine transport system permease protein GlnP n=1 Tax=Desulfosporosinus acididurans TaxID=476652 RepID=A0A0J1FL81_9FIRM|nr:MULTISPECIES: amino acid ABC transporter permease [Desulfosporosinus]KLU64240.1 glutamine transport system permease protein GlnP [Desulfosporosinus acididurans]
MNFFQIVSAAMPQLIKGAQLTVWYSIASIILATVLGLAFALLKLSRFAILRRIGEIYVHIFRGLPLLVEIFYIYFAIPMILPMHKWFDPYFTPIAGIIALALNEGAYITEIIRAGILAVDRGQSEAALSIGMTGPQTMRFIILPQAFKRMVPPLVNQFIQTIKDTSLLSAISVTELTRSGQIIISTNFASLQIWTAIAAVYLIIILLLTALSGYLERRWQIDKR